MTAARPYTRADFDRFFRRKYVVLLRSIFSPGRRPRYRDPALLAEIAAGYRNHAPAAAPRAIPRHIFMLWQQGWDAAPPIVRAVAEAWRMLNPGWALHLLDDQSFRGFAPTWDEFRLAASLGRQARANVARLSLLKAHGGVWADATLFPTRPLDDWLSSATGAGIFMFSRPRPYRDVDIWFIAAAASDPAIAAWHEQVRRYFATVTRTHHYYWMEYLFELLAQTDADVADAYATMPRLSALGPLAVAGQPFDHPASSAILDFIAQNRVPVHKLSHRWGTRGDISGTPLSALTGLNTL